MRKATLPGLLKWASTPCHPQAGSNGFTSARSHRSKNFRAGQEWGGPAAGASALILRAVRLTSAKCILCLTRPAKSGPWRISGCAPLSRRGRDTGTVQWILSIRRRLESGLISLSGIIQVFLLTFQYIILALPVLIQDVAPSSLLCTLIFLLPRMLDLNCQGAHGLQGARSLRPAGCSTFALSYRSHELMLDQQGWQEISRNPQGAATHRDGHLARPQEDGARGYRSGSQTDRPTRRAQIAVSALPPQHEASAARARGPSDDTANAGNERLFRSLHTLSTALYI